MLKKKNFRILENTLQNIWIVKNIQNIQYKYVQYLVIVIHK